MKAAYLLTIVVIFVSISCGDEDDGVSTPPVEEWCDVDREREDCELDMNISVNNGTIEEVAPLCETSCQRVKLVSFQNADSELLKSLTGFTHIGSLNIGNSHRSVTNLAPLKSLRSSRIIRIDGNDGLESLAGLENLEKIEPAEGFEPTDSNQLLITENPKLTSVSALSSLKKANEFNITLNSALRTIESMDAFEEGSVRIRGNRSLENIEGFESLTDESLYALRIIGNQQLTDINGFQNLTRLNLLDVSSNQSLDSCQAERILNQLDERPEFVTIEENGAPCNE